MKSIRRVAIVNRGEAAVRLIRAVRELSRERGEDWRVIALHTDPDDQSLFVREADETWSLGSASFEDPRDGRRKSRYLDYEALERALVETRADAAWVGWGFVAEHEAFAELCRRLEVAFIGPTPETMRALGDKIGSKRLAEKAGVPVAPWSGGPVADLDAARGHAEQLGYPLMVKATAGGGGRGIRRVRNGTELADAFESARSEALKGFGDDTVFMERLLEGARHIEVQIVGDGQGGCWALGVRDCTVQRRNQKVIEESPSPVLTPEEHEAVCAAAVRLGLAADYRNAGTVEFLFDPVERVFSFMEVNARLQVEHPVTECTSGADLVKLQLFVAAGGRLEGDPPPSRGHAIEVRVNAEDPERGFAPSPGRIELFRPPSGPGIRVDSGFVEGDRIAPDFDSMLAKVIASGRDRREALSRLQRALREMRLAVKGGATNKGFLLGLLERDEVLTSEVDVGWLDRLAGAGEHLPKRHAEIAVLQGAVDAYEAERQVEQARFYATAARGRLRVRREVGCNVELRCRGAHYVMRVRRVGPFDYRIDVDGQRLEVRVEPLRPLERRFEVAGRAYHVLSITHGLDQLVEVDGIPHRLTRDDAGIVRAPAPSVVLSLTVGEGDEVERGDRLAVLEAMKSELQVVAPCAGKVRQVLVSPNVQVDSGAPLVVLEPVERDGDEEEERRVAFPASGAAAPTTPGERCIADLHALRSLLLGFDIDPAEAGRLAGERARACDALPADDPDLLEGEADLLRIFTDVCALFERREADPSRALEARTPEEYLLLYLRSLDAEAAGLSTSFVDRLQRALRHYGVESLERSPALEEAMVWIAKAHERVDEQVDAVLAILERRLDLPDLDASEEFRALLDRIVVVTRRRFPSVSDLAREVRYRRFDRPFFHAVRERIDAEADDRLEALVGLSEGPEAEALRQALVECPEPLITRFLPRFDEAHPGLRGVMLEIATRRYYRIREIGELSVSEVAGRSVASTRYAHEGTRVRALTTHARLDEVEDAARAIAPLLAETPDAEDAVIDLYVWHAGPRPEDDAAESMLRRALEAAGFPRSVRRVVAVLGSGRGERGMGGVQHFTWRSSGEGLFEENIWRGLHPMMGKRLQLWRLANFDVQRIDSAEDVYLFHGVARSNPKDERLFAFAEVRDLSAIRDKEGRLLRLPRLESVLLEAFAAIRLFQSRRGARRRLQWNRVLLYVWPALDLPIEELNEVAHRLLPAGEDLGLQKVVARARVPMGDDGELHDTIIQIATPGGREVVLSFRQPAERPISPLSEYDQQVVRLRQRGLLHPFELIQLLTPSTEARSPFPPGDFTEYDLEGDGPLRPVDRAPGRNTAKLVTGVIRNYTTKHPEGMTRVLVAGDPSREMGSFAEPECRRILAALELAEELGVPIEWFPVSAGAKIAMDTGTENLDWTALVLRKLIEFTQQGGEVNIVTDGINVGGQSYWNAEAAMLMHTRGILVMTPGASMVLTGKKALDYSGGISAEDHQGIGGYERIMGVNGEGQFFAADIGDACRILFHHYEHAYVAPGERFPRRANTDDPIDRDVCAHPYGEGAHGFDFVGDVFSDEKNPGRRRPFDIRRVMGATVDQDHEPLERWHDMREAEVAVVWDAHLGGLPVCLIGFESQPIPRLGFVPADGPEQWTAGTLFPLASKKVARAVNAASGNRPVVILANLSGFDGSPESLRRLQLEYGAEIGRAVVNFQGPMVFCVVSRYHGGAYVVFSRALNENLEIGALEGSFASVIGGAPAAAVVFSGDVDRRTREDPRLQELEGEIGRADDARRGRLRARWHELFESVRSEKLGEVAEQFDQIHTVQRAQRVGSLHHILPPRELRPYLVGAVERGMRRTLGEREEEASSS
ncbi:MAG: biotin carboxylase N-terminal domain-containing protein [Myxococcota bacterium]